MDIKKVWGAHSLSDDVPIYWNLGSLQLWSKSIADELWLTYQYGDLKQSDNYTRDDQLPETPAWNRWSLKQSLHKVQLQPAFPDLPIVVKPEYPFRVIQNVHTKMYVRIPVWVQVLFKKTVITELPSVVLSKTWFGNFVEGELCYWISTAARKQIEPDLFRPFLCICPIEISNSSEEELLVEKICLRVGRLSLYNYQGQLWGSETKIIYHGRDRVSNIEVSRKAPSEASKAERMASSRDESKVGFAAKTFASLKDLPGIGFLIGKE